MWLQLFHICWIQQNNNHMCTHVYYNHNSKVMSVCLGINKKKNTNIGKEKLTQQQTNFYLMTFP